MCVGTHSGTNGASGGNEGSKPVPCIAKFRPRKGWQGEYGFDWIREDNDPYHDQIKASGNDLYDLGYHAMEYLYNIKSLSGTRFIKKVVYRKKGKAWIVSKIDYYDYNNGYRLIKDNDNETHRFKYPSGEKVLNENYASPLNNYIIVGNDHLSLNDSKNAPIYCGIDHVKGSNNTTADTWGWDRDSLRDSLLKAHDFLFRDKQSDIPYISLKFSKGNYNLMLRYVNVKVLNVLVVMTKSGGESWKYWYKSGRLHGVFFDNKWWKPDDFSNFYDGWFSNRKTDFDNIVAKTNLFSGLGIENDLLSDDSKVRIDELILKDWSDIEIVVNSPNTIRYGSIPDEAKGTNDCNVKTWQEEYEARFDLQPMKCGSDEHKYYVPVLSISPDLASVVVKISIREGSAPNKLYFKNEGGLVQVEKDDSCVFSGSEKEIHISRLKRSGKTHLYVYADKDKSQLIGQLKIIIPEKHTMPVLRVRVGNNAPDIGNNESFAQGIMSQAGINLVFKPFVLELDANQQSKINSWVNSGKYDLNDERIGYLCGLLCDSLRNSVLLKDVNKHIIIFVFDRSIDANGRSRYDIKSSNGVIFPNVVELSSTYATSTIPHELLHISGCPHVFQLFGGTKRNQNDFCFPLKTTSNIMDYSPDRFRLSLHQYQWEKMISFAEFYEKKLSNSQYYVNDTKKWFRYSSVTF